jgi:hypothetical protein
MSQIQIIFEIFEVRFVVFKIFKRHFCKILTFVFPVKWASQKQLRNEDTRINIEFTFITPDKITFYIC